MHPRKFTDRRTVIKTIGGGIAGLSLGPGGAAGSHADWFPPLDRTEWGDPWMPEGSGGIIQTFLTPNGNGAPQYLGLYVQRGALRNMPSREVSAESSLPRGSPFEFSRVMWLPHGHPPEGVWTEPHLEWLAYLIPQSTVNEIRGGAADYAIPRDQLPAGYVRTETFDTDGNGQPDTPKVTAQTGEFLIPPDAPEFSGGEFGATQVWGAADLNSDNIGRLICYAPMITRDHLMAQKSEDGTPTETRQAISMPAAFPVAGRYPTKLVIRHRPDQASYVITLERFEEFPPSES